MACGDSPKYIFRCRGGSLTLGVSGEDTSVEAAVTNILWTLIFHLLPRFVFSVAASDGQVNLID
jgi:hypothetical protein